MLLYLALLAFLTALTLVLLLFMRREQKNYLRHPFRPRDAKATTDFDRILEEKESLKAKN